MRPRQCCSSPLDTGQLNLSRIGEDKADLQKLTIDRLRDAKTLLAGRRWSGAYHLAGYAVECALKSCVIAYLMRTDQYPEKRYSEHCYMRGFVCDISLVDEGGGEVEDGLIVLLSFSHEHNA